MADTHESAVRSLIARYSDAVWRLDPLGYGSCWAPDGVWRLMGQSVEGRDAVVGFWQQFMKNFAQAWQTTQSAILAIGDRTGTGRLYVDEMVRMHDGSTNISRGIYHDSYVKQDGAWLFARRHFDLVYFGPSDFSGRFFPTVEYGPAPRDPDPTRPATPSMQEFLGA